MPDWGQVLAEIQKMSQAPGAVDKVRRKYLSDLHNYTKRNIILYYSGWLQRSSVPPPIQSQIYDGDINSFMAIIHGMNVTEGLDLIMHTPGGFTSATEAIVNYLRAKFGTNIRCFVPQLAMSGGTMIACACKEIYMGKQSSIGPIDPQFGDMAAFGVIDEFNLAAEEIRANPAKIPLWQAIYSKIPAGFITECQQAIDLSEKLALTWLETGMFNDQKDAKQKAKTVVKALNNHRDTKAHGRHITAENAKTIGLNIKMLEEDQTLQDLVLTVHHACMHTFSQSANLHKMVENHKGIGMFIRGG